MQIQHTDFKCLAWRLRRRKSSTATWDCSESLEFVGLVRIICIFGRVLLSGHLRFVSLAFEFAFSLHSPVLTMQHGAVTMHE